MVLRPRVRRIAVRRRAAADCLDALLPQALLASCSSV